MIRFIVCDADGAILRSGVCRDGALNLQSLNGGEIAVEIAAEDYPVNDETHKVVFTETGYALAAK